MSGILNVMLGQAPASAGTTYRYLRLYMTASGGSTYELTEVEWMVGATAYPTSDMTSNTAPSPLVASASSDAGAPYLPYVAFNGTVAARGWISAVGGTQWLKVDLGSGNGITPTGIKISPYATGGYNSYPTAFEAQGSNNDSSWTTLYTASGLTTGWTHYTLRTFTF